jgi:hypothetical protein
MLDPLRSDFQIVNLFHVSTSIGIRTYHPDVSLIYHLSNITYALIVVNDLTCCKVEVFIHLGPWILNIYHDDSQNTRDPCEVTHCTSVSIG